MSKRLLVYNALYILPAAAAARWLLCGYRRRISRKASKVAYGNMVTGSRYLAGSPVTTQVCLACKNHTLQQYAKRKDCYAQKCINIVSKKWSVMIKKDNGKNFT